MKIHLGLRLSWPRMYTIKKTLKRARSRDAVAEDRAYDIENAVAGDLRR